jgi:hypothetical protein
MELKFTLIVVTAKNVSHGSYFCFRVRTFETDYIVAEDSIYSFIDRFEAVKRKISEKRDEWNRKIQKLQNRVIRLEKALKLQII